MAACASEEEKRNAQRLLFPPSAVFDGLCSVLRSLLRNNVAASALRRASRQDTRTLKQQGAVIT